MHGIDIWAIGVMVLQFIMHKYEGPENESLLKTIFKGIRDDVVTCDVFIERHNSDNLKGSISMLWMIEFIVCSRSHHANECGCYRMRRNTFGTTNYINTYRIFMIFISFESPSKGLSNGAKIIKIR